MRPATSRRLLNLMIQSAVSANGRGTDLRHATPRRGPRVRCALQCAPRKPLPRKATRKIGLMGELSAVYVSLHWRAQQAVCGCLRILTPRDDVLVCPMTCLAWQLPTVPFRQPPVVAMAPLFLIRSRLRVGRAGIVPGAG